MGNEITGTAGPDVLVGTPGDDAFLGKGGDDTICGLGGNDSVYYYDVVAEPWSSMWIVEATLATGRVEVHRTDDFDEVDRLADDIEQVYGSDYNDWLQGRDQPDGVYEHLDGTDGDDLVYGLGGHDHLDGGLGDDSLHGGDGNDNLTGHVGADILEGAAGTDRLAGEDGNDYFLGGEGFDYVDYLCTSTNDFCGGVSSGQYVDLDDPEPGEPAGRGRSHPMVEDENDLNDHGNDWFDEVEGVRGSPFDDKLIGTNNVQDVDLFGDYFWPGAGDDIVDGRDGPDYVDYDVAADDPNENCDQAIVSNPGLDLTLVSDGIPSEGGPDTTPEVTGYLGSDQLANIEHAIGSPRQDTLTGTAGNNDLWGGCGDDILNGGAGNDGLNGDDQNDVVNAGSGDDKLIGGGGDDALQAGPNQDIVSYDGAINRVEVHLGAGTAIGEGEDAITSAEIIFGSGYNDVLVGGSRRDILLGGTGADELWGRGGPDVLLGSGGLPRPAGAPADGADRIYGGTGTDTADYSRAGPGGVVVNLAAQTAREGATDHVSSIEVVQGSDYNDTLRGDAAANRLLGGNGGDTLDGEGGNDYVDGQDGSDVVRGGNGSADVVDYGYDPNSRVSVNLSTGVVKIRESDLTPRTESVGGVEVVAGTKGTDDLRGSSRSDYFAGGSGNDALNGLGGNDFLFGQFGTDTFAGGSGADVCNKSSGESTSSCETKASGTPGWYVRVTGPREFRADGTDAFLEELDTIIEELRRLHRRRLHR